MRTFDNFMREQSLDEGWWQDAKNIAQNPGSHRPTDMGASEEEMKGMVDRRAAAAKQKQDMQQASEMFFKHIAKMENIDKAGQLAQKISQMVFPDDQSKQMRFASDLMNDKRAAAHIAKLKSSAGFKGYSR